MRPLVATLWILGLVAAPARADLPIVVDGQLGAGIGFARHRSSSAGPAGALFAVDVSLDRRPGRRWCVSGVLGAAGGLGGRSAEYRPGYWLDSAAFASVLGGIESSRGDGGTFVKVLAGPGRMEFDGSGSRRDDERWGIAVGLVAGGRWIPEPGPLGFNLTLRTHHVHGAAGAQVHAVAIALGLSVDP